MKIYGPYIRKEDGRQHVIIVNDDGSRRTVSYPKYLMEQHLGRELHPDLETIHHKDEDFTNNEFSNLEILTRVEHAKIDALHRDKMLGICVWCNKEFELSKNQINTRAKSKAGPFCSRSCSGKYGADVQKGGKVIKREEFTVTYHKISKD